jgi:hypothetical protein
MQSNKNVAPSGEEAVRVVATREREAALSRLVILFIDTGLDSRHGRQHRKRSRRAFRRPQSPSLIASHSPTMIVPRLCWAPLILTDFPQPRRPKANRATTVLDGKRNSASAVTLVIASKLFTTYL